MENLISNNSDSRIQKYIGSHSRNGCFIRYSQAKNVDQNSPSNDTAAIHQLVNSYCRSIDLADTTLAKGI